jgi:hypothetical protein
MPHNAMPHYGVPVCPKTLRQRPSKTMAEKSNG